MIKYYQDGSDFVSFYGNTIQISLKYKFLIFCNCFFSLIGGSSLDAFMTEDQKKYIAAMKKASTKKPMKALPRPYWRPQAIIFGVITNKKFDMIIMAFIGVNMVND